MNDQPTPFSDDELSAALDGEVDAEVQARIDADPDATRRSAELAAAADHLRAATVPPLDPGTVDDLVATALDVPVAPARRSARATRGPAPWLVAAGVIVLMAFGLTLIWAGRNAQDDQASAKFDTVGASISTEKSSGAASGGSTDAADAPMQSAPSTTAVDGDGAGKESTASTIPQTSTDSLTPYALGSFADGDALRAHLATSAAEGWTSAEGTFGSPTDESKKAPSDAAFDRCAQQLQVTLSLDDPAILMGYATVGDQQVVVYEFPATSTKTGKPTTLVAAVGVDACEQVIIFER